jgi:small subunit ribosomal protein S18
MIYGQFIQKLKIEYRGKKKKLREENMKRITKMREEVKEKAEKRKCKIEGCKKQPTYNFEGESKPLFCKEHKEPNLESIDSLKRFITERGKILSRARSGLCAQHQRKFSSTVKQARFLALLAFTSKD